MEEKIKHFSTTLNHLLEAKSIKYSEWNENKIETDKNELRNQAGVYHFFRNTNGNIDSLYVGKGGFGNKETWNLFKRLSQHFQVSQTNTLLGKYAKKEKLKVSVAKSELEKSNSFFL